jgi:homoserine kinase type II
MGNEEEIEKILDNWDIGKVVYIKKLNKGAVNNNWLIKTNDNKYVFRKFNKEHKISNLKFELSYLLYLKDKKFPYKIPAPLLTNSKKGFLRRGKDLFGLYHFIEGDHTNKSGRKELSEIALMMTRFHDIIQKSGLNNQKSKKKNFGREGIIKEMEEFISKIPSDKNKRDKIFLRESKKMIDILKKLRADDYNSLKQYPIHRDFNPENLLWKNGKLSGVIDFENVGNTNDIFVRDIAILMQYFCKNKKFPLDIKKAKFFIKEYQRYRKLKEKEIRVIIDLIIATNIEDFGYAYYLLINTPERAKISHLKSYSKTAQYLFDNRDRFTKAMMK